MRKTIEALLSGNSYPGRGIIIGKTPDGKKAITAYFIMGRSENSRNRVLEVKDGVLYTKPLDKLKLTDPSLIIYSALRSYKNNLIISNGDQTDTIYTGLQEGKGFEESLLKRTYEPDSPNFTPRISGLVTFTEKPCRKREAEGCASEFKATNESFDSGSFDSSVKKDFSYQLSILKKGGRLFYSYDAECGSGHLIHTYKCGGDPLPSFEGEPKEVEIPDDTDAFIDEIWNSLDTENRISLYVRVTCLNSGAYREAIKNTALVASNKARKDY